MLSILKTLMAPDVTVVQILPAPDKIVLIAEPTAKASACPRCGCGSSRIHSHYVRRLSDLPWQGRTVEIQLHARRFRCCDEQCCQQIFTERIAQTVGSNARRTVRLGNSQRAIDFAVGGEPGARLSEKLAMPLSGDTVLRLIRKTPIAPFPNPRVVGIDDWAWRKGQRYGTMVCDLERNQVIELLPDRETGTVANWLRQYPDIEIIARDRARFYAEAATRGAPQARQVADRWHLLRNLGDALQTIADKHRRDIGKAWKRSQLQQSAALQVVAATPDSRRRNNQVAREERYQEIKRLHHHGVPYTEIAKVVGLSHQAVSRWLKAAGPPTHDKPRQPRLIDAFETQLERRWLDGCRNGSLLWREIRAAGFTGTERTVRRWTKARCEHEPVSVRAIISAAGTTISSREYVRLLTLPVDKLTDHATEFKQELEKIAPAFLTAVTLAKTLSDLMQSRDPVGFDAWLLQAKTGLLGRFARGLEREGDAIRAAFEEIWSTSPVEGQINRLKFIKRRMYGRAKQDLLRKMVLAA